MSNTEQTLSIIKPDAVDRNLENEIKEMFKNNGFSILAFSTLSEPCTEFLSIEIQYFFLIVPSFASLGLVAPINSLLVTTAFSFSRTITTIGPDER